MKEKRSAPVEVIHAGLIPYKEAWDLQTRLHQQLVENKRAGYPQPPKHYLILCEHPPVYTLGKSGSEDNLRIAEQERNKLDIEYYQINRGGDITYHGPGQIVGYPILDLDLIFTDVHRYVRSLEEVIIRVLKDYGLSGYRNDRYTGVWINPGEGKSESKKICAIGVHLSRWVTMHGFAFNVNTDLSYFNHIIPCGIGDPDKSVCSLKSLLRKEVNLQQVMEAVTREFGAVFDLTVLPQPIKNEIPAIIQNH